MTGEVEIKLTLSQSEVEAVKNLKGAVETYKAMSEAAKKNPVIGVVERLLTQLDKKG